MFLDQRRGASIAYSSAAIIAALAASGGASASPASAAGGGQITAATPLREVVYKVSYTRRLQVSNETFGGQVQNVQLTQSAQAPPFNESNNEQTDSGTVTIDIMQIGDDALGMRVSERWTGSTPSGTYLGNVASDGSVNFRDAGQMNECTRSILEYFGTDVMAGQPANTGVAWSRTATGQGADVTTTYSVGDIIGAIASIHEQSTVSSKSVAAIDTSVTTDVQYKPAVLVPVSGKVVLHARQSGASSVTNISTVANFERISDTRDSSP
jgi:hypothetical protein